MASASKRRRAYRSFIITSELRSLNDFPDEILLKIFSHFGLEDLCVIIAKVCARWSTLAKHVTLWNTIPYECNTSSDFRRVAQVLREAPALRSFSIHKRKDAAYVLESLFDRQLDLKQLILKSCSLGENGSGLLAKIVTLYPDLEVLILEDCRPLTRAACAFIPHLKNLTELNLSGCEVLDGSTVCLIAESCQQLKKFYLDNVTQICDDDITHVVRKLGKQLTALIVDGFQLTDVAFSCLSNCDRLQELGLSCCEGMTDKVLLQGIGSLQELKSLVLRRGPSFTAQALSTFLHRTAMTSIVCLDLSHCLSLDDNGVTGIAERCMQLRTLSLCWCCAVTDVGISMVICHCNRLRELDLLGVILLTGAGYFDLVPSHLPHLRRLNLQRCSGVCHKSLEELVTIVPELEVIDCYGDRVRRAKNRPTYSSTSEESDA